MKKIFLLFLLVVAMTSSAFSESNRIVLQTHQTGLSKDNLEIDRHPIILPIAVYYDSDTKLLEVWCDDDNIQAEVYVYDESDAIESYSPYMNVVLTLTSSNTHYILIKGEGWEGEAILNSNK